MGKFYKGIVPWNKGIQRTEEVKEVLSQKLKGRVPWNKGLTKQIDERVLKNSISHSQAIKGKPTGRKHSEKTKEKQRKAHLGKKFSEEHRKHISQSRIGKYGGITNIYQMVYRLNEYVNWRINIFKRDEWKCQCCGGKGPFNSHHIKTVKNIINENNIKNKEEAIKCNELWDINNGVTLCIECHKLVHKKKKYE